MFATRLPKYLVLKVIARYSIALAITLPQIAIADKPAMSAGWQASLVADETGNLYQWGKGIPTSSLLPVKISLPVKVTQLFAAGDHAFAIDTDKALWAWGNNLSGQLGDGSTSDRTTPTRVLDNVVRLSSNVSQTLAIKADGSLWAWGSNYYGQLGSDAYFDTYSPIHVGDQFSLVAAGYAHSVGLRSDGTLWAWGDNTFGQLGNGTINSARKLTLIGTNYTAIAAGFNHSLGLKADGSLWAWGSNSYGQLGSGNSADSATPILVGNNYTAIYANGYTSLAIKSDGSAWTWGSQVNSNGYANYQRLPVQVATDCTKGALGTFHGMALCNGQLLTWGDNRFGQLGDGSAVNSSKPIVVGPDYVAFAAGEQFSVGLKSDQTVWAWGGNLHGQLGNTTADRNAIPNLMWNDVVSVAQGFDQQLMLTSGGKLWAWGAGTARLGLGFVGNQATPQFVGSDFSAIAAGGDNSFSLKSDGTLWAWGGVSAGILTTSKWWPSQVGTLAYSAIAAGYHHALALQIDGSLWAWGTNDYGQLGDGTTTRRIEQVRVGVDFKAVVAGMNHSLGIKTDGSLWGWGQNLYGQLGVTESANRLSPTQIGTGFIKVAAGQFHSLALKNDGSLWAWGGNFHFSVGDGTGFDRLVPIKIATDIIDIASGPAALHSLAMRSDGTLLAWGYNNDGQIGDGTFAWRSAPVLVIGPTADSFFTSKGNSVTDVPSNLKIPFFSAASGGITDTSAEVKTTTKFNAEDKGKEGAVYVTARVPAGSLGTSPVAALSLPQQAEKLLGAVIPSAYAQTTSSPTVLMQLTPTGWQPVTNGQLIPYASGVLGDALAAQTILNGVDTTNLKGAEFCLGYGTSASEMGAAGRMRTVATIPNPNAKGTTSIGCLPLTIPKGWNLLGHGLNQSFPVASLYGDTSWVNSVWKWDTTKGQWQFYAPLMDTGTLSTFTKDKGYGILTDIFPGEGYWVNATKPSSVLFQSGSPYTLTSGNLKQGWNLAATGATTTPSAFNTSLSATPPAAGTTPQNFTSLWAWDNTDQRWFFYAPSLEAQGGTALTEYLNSKGYKDFSATGKTLGPTTGVWVNR